MIYVFENGKTGCKVFKMSQDSFCPPSGENYLDSYRTAYLPQPVYSLWLLKRIPLKSCMREIRTYGSGRGVGSPTCNIAIW